MIDLKNIDNIYIASGYTDMRKRIFINDKGPIFLYSKHKKIIVIINH